MRTVTVQNTTLFHVAAAELGDATQWLRLAVMNGISDPVITGLPVSLSIPDINPALTGGIPQ